MSKSNSLNGSSSSGIRYGPEMRILIVGGGIAGLTLCALLEQRGFSPTVVERAHKYGNVGYVIVLWPSG
ncbi:MAG: NAD(P)-binding protein, partial [Candidatus Dadabacteria bacterium]|nr:NAD(P)-binding protein [Candidatus Dadabacteria bacterium]